MFISYVKFVIKTEPLQESWRKVYGFIPEGNKIDTGLEKAGRPIKPVSEFDRTSLLCRKLELKRLKCYNVTNSFQSHSD